MPILILCVHALGGERERRGAGGIKNSVTRREFAITRIRGDKGDERREGVERKEEEKQEKEGVGGKDRMFEGARSPACSIRGVSWSAAVSGLPRFCLHPRNTAGERYFFSVFGLLLDSLLQAHIDGKAHKKKVAALSVKGADLRCNLCDVTSTDKDGHERHMNGKRHKEKLEGPKEPKEREVIDYNNFNPKIAAVKEEVLVKEEVAA